jgi:hypothetical protein
MKKISNETLIMLGSAVGLGWVFVKKYMSSESKESLKKDAKKMLDAAKEKVGISKGE